MTKARVIPAIAIVLALIVAGGGFAIWQIASPPEISAFYDPPKPLPAGNPGEVIRTESLDSKFEDARVWRMLYHSTDLSGNDVAVSALVAAPAAAPPESGYPLIAVGHGTVGINRGCAPSVDPYESFNGNPTSYDFFIDHFVDAGYVVVMSDYQGLGTPGDSSYLIGEIEGRNILDSARAVLSFTELTLQPDILLWGQSQGGHAALFAAQIAPVYAPELSILGVAVEAPSADIGAIFSDLSNLNERGGVVALTLMTAQAWSKAYPGIDIDQLLTKRGKGALNNVVDDVCLMVAILGTQLARPDDLLQPDALEILGPMIQLNTPSKGRYSMPIFIGQGDADSVVPVSTNTHFAGALCASGNELTYHIYEGAGHFAIVNAAAPDVLAWMQERRAGLAAGTTC